MIQFHLSLVCLQSHLCTKPGRFRYNQYRHCNERQIPLHATIKILKAKVKFKKTYQETESRHLLLIPSATTSMNIHTQSIKAIRMREQGEHRSPDGRHLDWWTPSPVLDQAQPLDCS